jgi:hypothetical protein
MINIYADILLICCDISKWVLTVGFFTRAGVGMEQNNTQVRVWVRF